eukprot:scaffold36735_cov183-Amphora_coffeaeformis.AAC.2
MDGMARRTWPYNTWLPTKSRLTVGYNWTVSKFTTTIPTLLPCMVNMMMMMMMMMMAMTVQLSRHLPIFKICSINSGRMHGIYHSSISRAAFMGGAIVAALTAFRDPCNVAIAAQSRVYVPRPKR